PHPRLAATGGRRAFVRAGREVIMHLRTVSVVAAVLWFVPRAAGADGPQFGAAGQLVLSDDQSIGGVFGTLFSTSGTGPFPPSSTSAASFEFASVSNNGGTGTSFA